MYFNKLPNIYHQFDINGKLILKIVKDITTNVRFRKYILENITIFDEYDIKDGETPEIIALKYYGNPEYHWIIMLSNQRYNWVEDFPKTSSALEEYTLAKYIDPYAAHHWEKDGFVVMYFTPGASKITNYEYEIVLNESKRRIKLITPKLLSQILNNFNMML
jgi:hypothetical protein